MSGITWRAAGQGEEGQGVPDSLGAFLSGNERICVGLSSRLLRSGRVFSLPDARERLWLAANGAGRVEGAVLCGSGHPVFPVLPGDPASDRALGGLLASSGTVIGAALGLKDHVVRMEAAVGLVPATIVDYHLLELVDFPVSGNLPAVEGLLVRPARDSDFGDIFRLQNAYEIEEVYAGQGYPEISSLQRRLVDSLRSQVLLVAFLNGTMVGKAQTTAQGLWFDQIGGVYTLPGYRGRGIARALVSRLCRDGLIRRRKTVLYVKKGNAPAIALYGGLGFVQAGDYAAHYYRLAGTGRKKPW